jgi:hypothetical protein
MSLGFDPSDVPLHYYAAVVEYFADSVGVAMTAAAFAGDDEDT